MEESPVTTVESNGPENTIRLTNFNNFRALITSLRRHLEQLPKPKDVVAFFDIDGVFNKDGFFDLALLTLYKQRLAEVKNLLDTYPNLKIVFVTSRQDIYGWLGRNWIDQIQNALDPTGKNFSQIRLSKQNAQEEIGQAINDKRIILLTDCVKRPFEGLFNKGANILGYNKNDFQLDPNSFSKAISEIIRLYNHIFVLDAGAHMLPHFQKNSERLGKKVEYLNIKEAHWQKPVALVLTALAGILLKKNSDRMKFPEIKSLKLNNLAIPLLIIAGVILLFGAKNGKNGLNK